MLQKACSSEFFFFKLVLLDHCSHPSIKYHDALLQGVEDLAAHICAKQIKIPEFPNVSSESVPLQSLYLGHELSVGPICCVTVEVFSPGKYFKVHDYCTARGSPVLQNCAPCAKLEMGGGGRLQICIHMWSGQHHLSVRTNNKGVCQRPGRT